jgi:hypothetical protein
MNDKQQQLNNIRRFCKEYNIALQGKPSYHGVATRYEISFFHIATPVTSQK